MVNCAVCRTSTIIMPDGRLYVWGDSRYKQEEMLTRLIPVRETGRVKYAFSEHGRTIVVTDSGMVWEWGTIYDFDQKDYIRVSEPVPVKGLKNIIRAESGVMHSLALDDRGQVWVWGYRGAAIGVEKPNEAAVNKLPLNKVIQIASGSSHALALLEDGSVYSWVSNHYGELGDGTNTERKSPTRISELKDIVSIAAGENKSAVIHKDGTVSVWGIFYDGIKKIEGLEEIMHISISEPYGMAIDRQGNLFSFCYTSPEIDPDRDYLDKAVKISSISPVLSATCTNSFCAAITMSQKLFIWGDNQDGCLGIASTEKEISVPTLAADLNTL